MALPRLGRVQDPAPTQCDMASPHSMRERRYNIAVPASPQPQPNQPSASRPERHHIFKREVAGILMIGALVLILILIRHGHHIAWGAR